MLYEPIIDRLHAMRLHAMAQALEEQRGSSDSLALSFDERFALLVDRQYLQMQDRALRNRLRAAGLSEGIAQAEQTISSGEAEKFLRQLRAFSEASQ